LFVKLTLALQWSVGSFDFLIFTSGLSLKAVFSRSALHSLKFSKPALLNSAPITGSLLDDGKVKLVIKIRKYI